MAEEQIHETAAPVTEEGVHEETVNAEAEHAEAENTEAHAEEGTHVAISLAPEHLFDIGPLPVTNAMLSAWVVTITLIILIVGVARRMKEVPGPLQLFVEQFVSGIWGFVQDITNDHKLTKKAFPFFATLLAFFLASNLMGYVPGLAGITIHGHHAFRPPTTDYAAIFGITVMMFLVWQIGAITSASLGGYLKKFFNFKSPIMLAVGMLEIVGEFAKVVSLSFRLFGNIFAEEAIVIVMLALMPFVAPVPFGLLGLIASVIQALIFPLLITIYFTMAVEGSRGEH